MQFPPTPKCDHAMTEAELDEAALASFAIETPEEFAQRVKPDFEWAPHVQELWDELYPLTMQPIQRTRLVVCWPPRHGKTTSVLLMLAYLASTRPIRIGYASYSTKMTEKKAAELRRYFEAAGVKCVGTLEQMTVPSTGATITLRGIGAGWTGLGYDVLVCDDPLDGREDAESVPIREGRFEAIQADFLSRMDKPNEAGVVLIQCMAGDTSVLMADGTEKALRDIRTGDTVATYDSGSLSSSVVLNWANKGPDYVYEIRMSSGIVVKANERHPFLVSRDGATEWVRLRDLRKGDTILRAIGANGAVSSAHSMDANCRCRARVSASLTTGKPGGRAGTAPHRSTQPRTGSATCGTGTGLELPNTTRSSSSRADCAPSASSLRGRTCEPTGVESSAWTIATTPTRFEGCCATTAISQSDTGRRPTCLPLPLSTYEVTSDRITAIVAAGREDVFDIQVERTENFIANGLVSHNTRWHLEDPAGRAIKGDLGEKYRVTLRRALSEAGLPLWPARFPVSELAIIRARGEYNWWSLYQQEPRPRGTELFREPKRYDLADWLRTMKPEEWRWGIAVDPAATEKTYADHSVALLMAVQGQGDTAEARIVAVERGQWEVPSLCERVKRMRNEWLLKRVNAHIYAEGVGGFKAVAQILRRMLPEEFVREVQVRGDKFTRALPVSGAWNTGRVLVPSDAPWADTFVQECCRFTGVADGQDDQVDALAHAWNAPGMWQRRPALVRNVRKVSIHGLG